MLDEAQAHSGGALQERTHIGSEGRVTLGPTKVRPQSPCTLSLCSNSSSSWTSQQARAGGAGEEGRTAVCVTRSFSSRRCRLAPSRKGPAAAAGVARGWAREGHENETQQNSGGLVVKGSGDQAGQSGLPASPAAALWFSAQLGTPHPAWWAGRLAR